MERATDAEDSRDERSSAVARAIARRCPPAPARHARLIQFAAMDESRDPPPHAAPLVIGADFYASRLRAVLGTGGAWGLPRRERDRWILLHAIARRFRADESLGEKEATARIQDFLLAHAPARGLDAVTLRRALVDEGFVDRDDHGRDYRASRRHERRVRFDGAMPGVAEALAARPARGA